MTTSHSFERQTRKRSSTLSKFQEKVTAQGHSIMEHRVKPQPKTTEHTKWDNQFVIKSLPAWVYKDFDEPSSINECRALISATEYTLKDIDLQIEIKKADIERRSSHDGHDDYQRWRAGALRAKQTQLYLQSAYTYWMIMNQDDAWTLEQKLRRVIELLQEEPEDFTQQLEMLL